MWTWCSVQRQVTYLCFGWPSSWRWGGGVQKHLLYAAHWTLQPLTHILLHRSGSPDTHINRLNMTTFTSDQIFDLRSDKFTVNFDLRSVLNSQLQTSRWRSRCSYMLPGLQSLLLFQVDLLESGRSSTSQKLQWGPADWRPPLNNSHTRKQLVNNNRANNMVRRGHMGSTLVLIGPGWIMLNLWP